MSEPSTEPEIVSIEPTAVVLVREVVAMNELSTFFGRAFQSSAEAAGEQSVAIGGPPLAVYYSTPTETVDVGGGFPTVGLVEATGSVTSDTLPGGRAAQILHLGSYDSLSETYGRLMTWLDEQGLGVGPVMWEMYLNEPDPENPDNTITQIVWPLAEG